MITLNHIRKAYKDKVIFDDMQACFDQPGKVYAVLGPSGSGKTTLLQMLFGLDCDFSGDYRLFGRDTREFSSRDWDLCRSRRMQMVYQDDKLLGDLSVYDNLWFALNDAGQNAGAAIVQALEQFDLLELRASKVRQLSGGEKQRLALARATINHPSLLLLDEPTGSLDDENTAIVTQYIRRLARQDCIVIIITHDSRVVEHADIVYRLVGRSLRLETGSPAEPPPKTAPVSLEQPENPAGRLPRRAGLRFAALDVKSNIRDLLLHNIPIIAIFVVFILIFNLGLGTSRVNLDKMAEGISDQAVLIDLGVWKDDAAQAQNEKGITLAAGDGKRVHFRQQDIDAVRTIPGVEDALAAETNSYSGTDKDDYFLEQIIPLDDLPEHVKYAPGAAAAKDSVQMKFQSMNLPRSWVGDYNSHLLSLLCGSLPQDNSNELLLPDVIAYYEAEKQGCSLEQLVGREIQLEAVKYLSNETNNNAPPQKEKATKSYPICGIYRTHYQRSLEAEQMLITAYRPRVFPESDIAEFYQEARTQWEQMNPQSQAVCADIYSDYEHYKEAFGTGCNQLLIRMNSPGDSQAVSEALAEMFPNLKQLSQYDVQNGDLKGVYQGAFKLFLTGMLLLVLIFGVIITFLTRSHIKRKNRSMSILYSLGYSRWQVSRIILYENLIQTGLDLAAAYAIVVPAYLFKLQYSSMYEYFQQTLAWNSILGVCAFALLMMSLSIAWAVFGVRKKRLKKYLET